MGERVGVCDDAAMSGPRSLPAVARSRDRVLAGVAGGWAARWGVEPTVVRAAIGLLTLAGGIGAALYGVAALASAEPEPLTPRPDAPVERDGRRELALASGTAAVLIVARAVGLWPGDGVMLPAAAVAVGVAVAWARGPRTGRSGRRWMGTAPRVTAGVGLLAAGVASLANRTGGLADVGASASAIAVVVGGLAMFAVPALGRLLLTLDEERALRIREDERAAVAAHLHDSVLQSLVLLQRSDDPNRMVRLARQQERELRTWLHGPAPAGRSETLRAAVDEMTTEIERSHDLRVEAIVVGDQPLDDAARTLVAALREAVVNAARHAAVDRVDVFVEVQGHCVAGCVRDDGKGFDPAGVPDDRHGISHSIVDRVRRVGGTAAIVSHPGTGTEVELSVPRGRR